MASMGFQEHRPDNGTCAIIFPLLLEPPSGHRFTVQSEQVNTLQEMVAILREQLTDARERERDHRAQIAQLTHMLEQSQQRYDRLLEAPAPTAAPTPASRPRWPTDTRQRILDYMREHPGPHTPAAVQAALGLPQTPRHILRHLVEDNKLLKPAPGQYAYPEKMK